MSNEVNKPARKPRPLGEKQARVLTMLREYGHWYAGCGRVWDTESNTTKIMDSLVRRGDATRHARSGFVGYRYQPVEKV